MSIHIFGGVATGLSDASVLRTVDITTIEVCGHGVYPLLIHVVLIYLNRVPIIEVIFTITCLEPIYVSVR